MKTKASATRNAADEDEAEHKKIRSSRNHRHRRNHPSSSSSGSESPPRKRSKKQSKKVTDKKSKRNKVSSSRRKPRRRSLSPSYSLSSSSSSPSSIDRHRSSCSSSSSSERSVSPPPRSRSRDVHKKKGRGRDRDRERDRKRRKARRSASSSSTSASSDSSRSRSRSKSKHKKLRTVVGTTRDKIEIAYDNSHASRSEKNMADDDDRDEEALATIAKKRDGDIDRYKKNPELESQPSKNANQTQPMESAGGGNSDAEDLELILRQKALENFRKFRAAAAGKTDTNGATGKEALVDGSQNAVKEIAEANSSGVTHFQRQGSSLAIKNSAGSPRSEDCGNGTSHSRKQEGSAGMSHGTASPGTFEAGEIGCATQPKGRTVEATHSVCQLRSPQDGRNSLSVMQRLESTPGSCASVNQRLLGSSAGASHVNGAPRVRSVVSIPAREGLDGSTYTTPTRPGENSAPVESSRDAGRPLIDINKAERTNGDGRKTSEASASNGSILSPAEGKSQVRTDDKDGSQFQKKTFSRMHDGETVEVSYKVYIPKKTPALARRKLQR